MGCTANVCYIEKSTGKAYIANLGDSRSVYCKYDNTENVQSIKVEPLSKNHSPGDPEEQKRIEAAGFEVEKEKWGKLYRIYGPNHNGYFNKGRINLSRAIGHFFYK